MRKGAGRITRRGEKERAGKARAGKERTGEETRRERTRIRTPLLLKERTRMAGVQTSDTGSTPGGGSWVAGSWRPAPPGSCIVGGGWRVAGQPSSVRTHLMRIKEDMHQERVSGGAGAPFSLHTCSVPHSVYTDYICCNITNYTVSVNASPIHAFRSKYPSAIQSWKAPYGCGCGCARACALTF
jgi:hypothetical protein